MDTKQQLAHLAEMRALMERSTRFLSLSGLSGVWAGLCALAGAAVMYAYFEMSPFSEDSNYDLVEKTRRTVKWSMDYKTVFVIVALSVLGAALAGGVFFTTRKARQRGEKIWDASSRRLLMAMAIPLIAGGFFCIALLERGFISLLAPCTLIFYGLALIMGGKYTLRDVEYLGMCELALGLAGVYYPGFGLELWAIGFGILHIGYGLYMYFKYDSSSARHKA